MRFSTKFPVFVVETVTPHDVAESRKVASQTHVLKPDGSTETLKVGRTLTSQEESILLPLIQGLIEAGGGAFSADQLSKPGSTAARAARSSNARATKASKTNEKRTGMPKWPWNFAHNTNENASFSDSADSNILTELSGALNRLQETLQEEKGVVTDTRKRNTILTLVAWLKSVLQSTSGESASADAQLTDLLPTELLLSKLMPQLSAANSKAAEPSAESERSASSKRFSRQRNNRFNTVGVSQEELADARLYMQKKLLSENLASAASGKSGSLDQEDILADESDSRRKSLNLSLKSEKEIDHLLDNSKRSFSKSIDVIDPEADYHINAATLSNAFPTQSSAKVIFKRNAPATGHVQRQIPPNNSLRRTEHVTSDTDDDASESQTRATARPVNKFTMRKQKLKRANTIDVPKPDLSDDVTFSDENYAHRMNIQNNQASNRQTNADSDKSKFPAFQPKTISDQKYLAFMNKQNKENRMTWMSPNRGSNSPQSRNNWSNKFGNIKNTFERIETSLSPSPNKKNSFTHAPTSPFIPVPSSKPPPIPNGHVHHPQLNIVSAKVAAIQSNLPSPPSEVRPNLKSHQSLPQQDNQRDSRIFARTKSIPWNAYSAVNHSPDHLQTSYNPLYVPPAVGSAPAHQPMALHSPSKTPVSVSPIPPSADFPSYTYTSTDYTRPACVSTFAPDAPSPVRTPIKPDTSYIRTKATPSPIRAPLGSTRLSHHMKTVDYTSSSEYLSEPHGPLGHPNRIYADNSDLESREVSEAREFTALSQIMKYPQCQTATVINKATHRYDLEDERARELQSYLLNNVRPEPKYEPQYEPKYEPQYEPQHSPAFVQPSYAPPTNRYSNFQSMENLSQQPAYQPPTMKPAFSTHALHSQGFKNRDANFGEQPAVPTTSEKPKGSMVKVNSFGSQYMPPKLDAANPGVRVFRKKSQDAQGLAIMNNTSSVVRSSTIRHNRAPPVEIKRKQSLPSQGTDFTSMVDDGQSAPTHNYLPTGVLKRSKSGHTLALLHQFESLERDVQAQPGPTRPKPAAPLLRNEPIQNQVPLKSALKKPLPSAPSTDVPSKIPPTPRSVPVPAAPNAAAPKPLAKQPAPAQLLSNPEINEVPSSPGVEKDHIIYPGQTAETTKRVQHYAQTLNAMLNRKSLVMDDDKSNALQKTPSGSLLCLPKGKSIDIEEKERTVAAYFAGAKSPQGLQRSSSQHSVLSSSSLRALSNEHINANSKSTAVERTSTTTSTSTSTSSSKTIKSAHHLKILKKQSQASPLAKSQTMPSISNVNLLDESNVDDAFEDLFKSFTSKS